MSEPTFSRGRKWRIGFNVAIALLSAFALVVMANYLAARHPYRYNWSASASTKLSPLTLRVLNNLGTNKVKIIVFFIPSDPLFSQVSSLVKDYQALTPQLDVEFVNSSFPGRANRIRADFGLALGDGSRVIFQSGSVFKSVGVTELSDFSFKEGVPRRSAFKGEQLFTAAIMNVTKAKKMKAYFLSGHGEHNPESVEQSGYSKFVKLLSNASIDEVEVLDSLHNRDVPEDCSLLLITGPSSRFTTLELERIDRFLSRGGRLFVALPMIYEAREPTGLETLLARWNIDAGINAVQDREGDKVNEQNNVIIANKFGPHAITRPLLQSQLELVLPRSVGSKAIGATRADAPKTTELIFTSEKGIAVELEEKGRPIIRKVGSIPIAVAVEKGGIQGVAVDAGTTRIIVIGSSMSFANLALEYSANSDFASLAVNWLVNRDEKLMEIPPRAITEYHLSVTEKQMTTLRWVFIAGAPGAALLIGAFVWLKRRT